jgi:8-oxo-dGTP pyrophosphatase MutT (NUDIX family)
MASSSDELVDIVDECDNVERVARRSELRRLNLRHRVAFVAVRSSRAEVLVHRRSDTKDVWPGWWDLAVGGVVTAGETYDAAARRELAEEIGLTGVEPERIGEGSYEDGDVQLLARVYALVHDGPFTFVDDEVVEAHFVTLDELRRRIAVDSYVPDSVALVLPLL